RLNQRLIPTLVLDTTLASANYTLSLHDALPIYRIEAEQSLLTLESDKASMEIPAPKAGVIKSLAIKLGDRLKEGDDLLELEVDAEPAADAEPQVEAAPEPEPTTPTAKTEPLPSVAEVAAENVVEEIHVPDIGSA